MSRSIDVLNEEMQVARVTFFVGGLTPAKSARPAPTQPRGNLVVTDGPHTESKEHIGGARPLSRAGLRSR